MKRYFPVWVLPLFIAFSIGTVWLRLAAVRASYSVNRADRLIAEVQKAREKAEVKLASLKSPKRLEKIARERFGLKPAQAEQVVRLK